LLLLIISVPSVYRRGNNLFRRRYALETPKKRRNNASATPLGRELAPRGVVPP